MNLHYFKLYKKTTKNDHLLHRHWCETKWATYKGAISSHHAIHVSHHEPLLSIAWHIALPESFAKFYPSPVDSVGRCDDHRIATHSSSAYIYLYFLCSYTIPTHLAWLYILYGAFCLSYRIIQSHWHTLFAQRRELVWF